MPKSSKTSGSFTNLVNISTYEAGITQSSAFRLIKKITNDALQPYGITTTQWFMIGSIMNAGKDGISVTELSQILGTNLPFITNSVNVLVERNMVVRSSPTGNARARLLHIDPNFSPKVEDIETRVRDALRNTIYKSVTPEELLTYIQVLYKFNNIDY